MSFSYYQRSTWDLRKFSPTPGRSTSVFIPNFDNMDWFPIPESSNICGVCKEPMREHAFKYG